MKKWTIYMYTFPNGKRYVGATSRPLIHRQGSLNKNWENYKRCKLLYDAIQEYGIDSIEQTILFQGEIEDSEARYLESFYIEKYKTNARKYNNPSYGYNQTDGGEGVGEKVISGERREELRQQVRKFHEAKIGTHPTEESRKRMSESHLGQTRGIMPTETRKKISAKNTKKEPKITKSTTRGEQLKIPVIVENVNTGEKKLYDSSVAVSRFFGVCRGTVTRWIKGDRRPPEGYLVYKQSEVMA